MAPPPTAPPQKDHQWAGEPTIPDHSDDIGHEGGSVQASAKGWALAAHVAGELHQRPAERLVVHAGG